MIMVRTYNRKYTNTRNGKSYLPYQNYDSQKLQEAINCVKEGRMGLVQAANTYGVPKSTLSRKTRNINCTQENAGHPTLFSPEEENIFLKYILLVGEWGFPFETTDLRVFAQKYLNKIGKKIYRLQDNMPGVDWARNFLKRHCTLLSNRKSANISSDRAKFTCEDIDAFFENYTKTVEGVAADCIINYDETNLTDDPGNKNYIYRRGCKYPERVINTSRTAISLMFSGTASGHLLPIYVVYKSENLWDTWMEAGPEGTRYNRSKSGWFDSVCFEDWFNTIIVPYVRNKPGRKVLVGDNLSSHFSESVLRVCEELNIAFVCLPPKTTHLLQPLDVAFFAPLKTYWRAVLTKWKLTEGRKHKTLVKSAFPKLLCKLKDKLVEKNAESDNLKAGFNKSGLYPVDPNRPKSRLPKSQTSRSEEEIESATSSVITNILAEMRCPEVSVETRRKKRFVVEPGKSVTAEDVIKCQKAKKTTVKTGARSKQSGERKISKKKKIPDPFVDPIPGPSGLCNINNSQKYDSDISDDKIAPVALPISGPIKPYKGKGKGIGKKTKSATLTNEEKEGENSTERTIHNKTLEKQFTEKKKQLRQNLRKDSSTSVSDYDIMSTHSDSDIGDYVSDATIEADDFYSVSESILKTKTGDKTDLTNATEEIELNTNARNFVISEIANTTGNYEHSHQYEMGLNPKLCQDPLHIIGDEMTITRDDYELERNYECELVQKPSYSVGDFVIVRYFNKKTWTYYVGVMQEIYKEINGQYKFNVVFFKTVKRPRLAFRKTRLVDRDIIDELSIVKQISLVESPNNHNELCLAEDADIIYFK